MNQDPFGLMTHGKGHREKTTDDAMKSMGDIAKMAVMAGGTIGVMSIMGGMIKP